MTDGTDLRALLDEIEGHPGTRARREWDALATVHYVMIGNQAELVGLIRAIEQNQDDLALTYMGSVGSPKPREALYRELVRLLHNYLAGAVTLVDHTRNLMRRYEGTPAAEEFSRRVAAVRSQGISPFINKLRVYVLHYDVPPIGGTLRFANAHSEMEVTLFLNRDRAMQWPDWPVAARAYLEAQAEQVGLLDLITEYAALIEDLYLWLYDQFPVLHAADIDAVNQLISRTPGYRRSDGSRGAPPDGDVPT
jgi:hypothetical protein